jgi:phosphopantothenoylcysteine decarboxylase/phosphopantothenate--cysteine ligase
MSAAVADFKPAEKIAGKIKKHAVNDLTIRTRKTTDILKYLASHKNGCKLVGFALEIENELENAREKILNKNLDLLVINNPLTEGAGFGSDTNVVSLMDRSFNVTKLDRMSKYEIGHIILNKVIHL